MDALLSEIRGHPCHPWFPCILLGPVALGVYDVTTDGNVVKVCGRCPRLYLILDSIIINFI
jgi:hypothetical protein